MEIIIIGLVTVSIILNIVLLLKSSKSAGDAVDITNLEKQVDNLSAKVESNAAITSTSIQNMQLAIDAKMGGLKDSMSAALKNLELNSESLKSIMEKGQTGIDTAIENGMNKVSVNSSKQFSEMKEELSKSFITITKENTKNQEHLSDVLQQNLDKITENSNKNFNNISSEFNSKLVEVIKENKQSQGDMQTLLQRNLQNIQEATDKRLSHIQDDVNKKLDNSLNERLDKSFDRVAKQLSDLYQSLGQLNEMQGDIDSLNKTLSNVKTRGTWGEIQLEKILEETMREGQYEKNFRAKKGSRDVVEFALKIPSKEDDGTFIYLPIDSKFPADTYNKIVEASLNGDKEGIETATKELAARIKDEAKDIADKYIEPPVTTDFAIMFLPTESMYAEVLKINGLAEECQTKYRVVISGPSTITALLMSLQIGFRNLVLAKKTEEVRNILEAVKAQYKKLNELVDKTNSQLERAMKSTGELKSRTEQIQKRMTGIHALETVGESDKVLGIEEGYSGDTDVVDEQI